MKCFNCGEELLSQIQRGPYYFHRHVVYGPYPNPEPHPCRLVDAAFTAEGREVEGYAEGRYALTEAIHGKVKPTPISGEVALRNVVNLHDEFDAWVWAKEFCRIYESDPDLNITEDWMATWFANAIMAGYDHAKREASK